MKKPLDFIVRNSKSTPRTSEQSYSSTCQALGSERKIQTQFPFQISQNQEQRLKIFQGNLRLLEHKYKQNLKEGFDNKIKAYRMQAVVERKLLQQAVYQAQKFQEQQQIRNKIMLKQELAKQRQEKVLIYKIQKMQKDSFVKKRNQLQKRRMSVTLYQRESYVKQTNRAFHDRIRDLEEHSGQKKNYFQELRNKSNQKEALQTKRKLLEKIVKNTQKLRNLKQTLEGMQSNDSNLFLTLG